MRTGIKTPFRFFSVASFILMIAVNVLAELIPLGGKTTGEIAAQYPNLFTPAPYTFSIWGLIYLLLLGFLVFQVGFFQKKGASPNPDLLRDAGYYFTLTNLLNTAWILAWHYEKIALSVVIILFLFICLFMLNLIIKQHTLTPKESLFIQLPFRVYLGWITVAVIANIAAFIVSLGVDGFSTLSQIITVIVLVAGAALGILIGLYFNSIAYLLVIVWAYIGILVKHLSDSGFAGEYRIIIFTVVFCIILLLLTILLLLRKNKKTA